MKATILLVDDEPDNLKILTDYLKLAYPDAQLRQAKNGLIATKIMEKEKVDLVLTDWNMPVMSGLELTKFVRAKEEYKYVPVVMQTANTEDKQLKEAFEAGVMDYIKKPISELELLARVKSAVEMSQAKRKAEELLLKIFPQEVVEELKEYDDATPKHFKNTSILFADVNGFSSTARRLKNEPEKLVKKLDECFEALDDIAVKYDIERIRTIGDCYMAVAGIPTETKTHAVDLVLAGLEMQKYMEERTQQLSEGEDIWRVRLGIHTGDLVAGIIGKVKFAYDVWGDSVNLASRMESTGEVGKVHITETTYELIKDFFECEKKAELVYAKNIGEMQTYFVLRIKPEYSEDEAGFVPSERFAQVKQEKFGS